MKDLDAALVEFVRVHAKFNLQGHFEKSNDMHEKWPNNLASSPEIAFLFNNYNPISVDFETGSSPYKFFELSKIEKAQYGYKWIESNGDLADNPSWKENHLVFVDEMGGGKPIIAVLDQERTPIYASYNAVKFFKIADSLADFFLSISKLIEIVYGEFDIYDIDDDELDSKFLDRIRDELVPIIGEANFSNFVDYFYG